MEFPFRLAAILSVCGLPAATSAATWTPVCCPEAARLLAGQFELVRIVEGFEDGPGGWACRRGIQQAEAAAAVGDGPPELARAALRDAGGVDGDGCSGERLQAAEDTAVDGLPGGRGRGEHGAERQRGECEGGQPGNAAGAY